MRLLLIARPGRLPHDFGIIIQTLRIPSLRVLVSILVVLYPGRWRSDYLRSQPSILTNSGLTIEVGCHGFWDFRGVDVKVALTVLSRRHLILTHRWLFYFVAVELSLRQIRCCSRSHFHHNLHNMMMIQDL